MTTPGRTTRLFLAGTLAAALAGPGCQPGGLRSDDSLAPADDREQRIREAADLAYQAKAAADKDKVDRAIELNRRALELDPDHVGALNNQGALLMRRENYRDAMLAFQRAADLLPRDPRPYENLALCWYEMGYDDNALNYYRKSLERDLSWLPSLRGYVACLQRLNKAEQAAPDHIRRALLIETDREWRALFERARIRIDSALAQEAASNSLR